MFRKKFCWVIIMASAWETLGFALRSYSTQNLRSLGPFVPSQLLIILSPLWLNAFVYMVLGRMIYFFLPEKKCFGITAKKLTLIFVLLDITAFLVQGSAASMLSGDNKKLVKIGIYLYIGGIAVQEFFILVFFGLALRFQYKMSFVDAIHPPSYPWRPLLYSVYAGLILITVRIIFRLCEYSQGVDTPLSKNEAAFYVLDAATMFIAVLLFNVIHPGQSLVGPESEFPKKEKKAKKRKNFRRNKNENDMESNVEGNEFSLQSQEPQRDYR
ncbi:hypothetical protein LOZ53_000678 [Ophidiomyces ophidiicola]|nr:hypothetical protein LOZ55_002015 [Ophidiomyces ophidiicola]KAI1992564.1 hypothetical protein LOZ54_001640 [Ophidiomyces ophidiicola]KAI1992893.1 hypothetical protein LOZ51_004207 [Ophidiomyces ophidiicola]KAI1997318.1 hypothetical protein LOZ53_000678 [Ophidiomyces ophidiicola]